jgi:hypothetical protein
VGVPLLLLLLLWFTTCVTITATKVATDATRSTTATHTAAFILGVRGGDAPLGTRDAVPASTSRGFSGVSAAAGALTDIVARGSGGLTPLGGAIRAGFQLQVSNCRRRRFGRCPPAVACFLLKNDGDQWKWRDDGCLRLFGGNQPGRQLDCRALQGEPVARECLFGASQLRYMTF